MIGEATSEYLFDTLLWTAALIGLVLLIRRPVTRWFGAPAAYALWAIPMLRLLLPPLHLPAWLAPTSSSPVSEAAASAPPLDPAASDFSSPATHKPFASVPETAGSGTSNSVDPTLWTQITDGFAALPLTDLTIALWLSGALIFIGFRFHAYFSLRDQLLADAREVGVANGPFKSVRLVETPKTNAPLAFGVLDPVIALPCGFMAQPDRNARDLALAHELAHHRGHDLLINILVQPLFALHWFNPLGRFGWLALRRDQEAACDARVVATAAKDQRAAYASVIASFAAGPNVALAAPMACPVLGDKSIIQRLRNLTMTQQSSDSRARRFASRAMMAGAVLALPLTASITYAEVSAPIPPAPPAAPALANISALSSVDAPEAPEPPSAPEAPEPPEPPLLPEIEEESEVTIITVDPAGKEVEKIKMKPKGKAEKIKTKNGYAYVFRDVSESQEGNTTSRYETVRIVNTGAKLTEQEREEMLSDLREGLADANEAIENIPEIVAEAMAEIDLSKGKMAGRTVVKMSCNADSDEVSTVTEGSDGTRVVTICQSRVMAQALSGLKEARKAISKNRDMDGKTRSKVLKELDRQIRDWEREAR